MRTGETLFRSVLRACPSAGKVQLILRKDNMYAQALYVKIGLEVMEPVLYVPEEWEVYMGANTEAVRQRVEQWREEEWWTYEHVEVFNELRIRDKRWIKQMHDRWRLTWQCPEEAKYVVAWNVMTVEETIEGKETNDNKKRRRRESQGNVEDRMARMKKEKWR